MTTHEKIALVTGANRGLGRAVAQRLAEHGVGLVLTYRSHAEEAEAVVAAARGQGVRATALRLDTGDAVSFDAFAGEVRRVLADQWGRDTFDFLVNNAGGVVMAPFREMPLDGFDEMVNVHLRGVYFLTQRLEPLLADGGRIVNVSTGLTRFTSPGCSAYASVKGAVEVLTRYLAKELGHRGITVNTVAPGPVATDFGGGLMRDNEDLRSVVADQTTFGRVGEPDDIAGVVAALLAGGTAWLTAQRVEASGGMLL